jgi:hypothetical protein
MSVRYFVTLITSRQVAPTSSRTADLARAFDVYGAGYSPSNSHDMSIKLTLELMGAKFRVISGLKSVADINNSILHKETISH